MALQEKRIPSRIDNQVQLLFWELDEFLIFVSCIFSGMMFDLLVPGIFVAALAARALSKLKRNSLRGVLHHIAYWHKIYDLNKAFTKGGEKVYFN